MIMLGLPRSTEVNHRVQKEKLYTHATLTPPTREKIKDQVKVVIWRNKLADSTMGISAGEAIQEIQVFEVQLRQRELDKRVLPAITKAIPYKVLFILVFGGEAQAWIEASGMFYHTDWVAADGFTLPFEGLNLDAMYANLARYISGGRLGADGDIEEAVDRDKQRQKIERNIATLEKKLLREKQLNRQVEMNGELKRLKNELEGLTHV